MDLEYLEYGGLGKGILVILLAKAKWGRRNSVSS